MRIGCLHGYGVVEVRAFSEETVAAAAESNKLRGGQSEAEG